VGQAASIGRGGALQPDRRSRFLPPGSGIGTARVALAARGAALERHSARASDSGIRFVDTDLAGMVASLPGWPERNAHIAGLSLIAGSHCDAGGRAYRASRRLPKWSQRPWIKILVSAPGLELEAFSGRERARESRESGSPLPKS